MNQYRPTIGIEPIDKYEKAKQDVLKARDSVMALLPAQQERLAKELFGVENYGAVVNLMQRMIYGKQIR